MTSELVKRLRAHKADIWNWNGTAMTAWDSWRAAIANGDKSSWPRDAFEGLIGEYGLAMDEAAARIEKLEAALRDLMRLVEEDPEEDDPSPYLFDQVCDRARAALEGK